MVERVGGVAAGDLSAQVAMFERLRQRVAAPQHPLADTSGRVPVEVFDLPPELLDAIRTLPIRPPVVPGESTAGRERPAGAREAEGRQEPRASVARVASEPSRGARVDLEA